jgi:hypothetical protein
MCLHNCISRTSYLSTGSQYCMILLEIFYFASHTIHLPPPPPLPPDTDFQNDGVLPISLSYLIITFCVRELMAFCRMLFCIMIWACAELGAFLKTSVRTLKYRYSGSAGAYNCFLSVVKNFLSYVKVPPPLPPSPSPSGQVLGLKN